MSIGRERPGMVTGRVRRPGSEAAATARLESPLERCSAAGCSAVGRVWPFIFRAASEAVKSCIFGK